MVTNFPRRRRPPHLYITEWREKRGLSLEALGQRIELEDSRAPGGVKHGVDKNTVWRWENEQNRLDPQKIAALAYALDLEPEELWRPPGRESLDAIMAGESDDLNATAADIVRRLTRRAS